VRNGAIVWAEILYQLDKEGATVDEAGKAGNKKAEKDDMVERWKVVTGGGVVLRERKSK
jgi:hypothetical protein